MPAAFVHLHTHSLYFPMEGVSTLEALCTAARAQGQDRLALTDTNGLYGAIRFLDVAREAGLAPILGAELVHGTRRAVLLAKTPAGYANLCRILSARHCDDFDSTGTVARHRVGLVILSDDRPALATWSLLFPRATPVASFRCWGVSPVCLRLAIPTPFLLRRDPRSAARSP